MFAESNMSDIYEPRLYMDAMKCQEGENWKRALDEEIKPHETNQTWTLEKLPDGKKCKWVNPCKWVYKVKINSDG